jgi:Cu-Zn family superoxide dismutase
MRTKTRFLLGGVIVAVLALAVAEGVGLTQTVPSARADNEVTARAVLRSAAGAEVGRVTFSQYGDKVLVRAAAHDLPPEFHGFHVHGVGSCVAPDFVSAGGHYNPTGQHHAAHAGDLPTLLVNRDGTALVRVATDRFRVTELLAGAGTAVIVHANRDNQANIPTRYVPAPDATTLNTGDAGARIACGVVEIGNGENEHDDD